MINPPSIETTGVPLSSGNSFAVKISNYITWYAGAKQLFRCKLSEPFPNCSFVQTFITTLFFGLIFLFMLSSASRTVLGDVVDNLQ